MSKFVENRTSDSGISMDDNTDRNSVGSDSSLQYNNGRNSKENKKTSPPPTKKLSYVQKMAARFDTICQKQQIEVQLEQSHLHRTSNTSNSWLNERKSILSSRESVSDSSTLTNTSPPISPILLKAPAIPPRSSAISLKSPKISPKSPISLKPPTITPKPPPTVHSVSHFDDEESDTKSVDDTSSVGEQEELEETADVSVNGDNEAEEECENEEVSEQTPEFDLQTDNDNEGDKIENWNAESEFGEGEDEFGEGEPEEDLREIPEQTANAELISHTLAEENNDEDADSTYSDSFEDTGSETEETAKGTKDVEPASAPASRPTSSGSLNSNKLSNIIRELIENEENYVRTLQKGIENYVSSLDLPNLPLKLRGQKRFIFGNIQRLYELHANYFCPELKECNEDVTKIAETFISFIEKDYFYCYVLFVLNRPKSERICKENIEFFQERQQIVGDKLGINSFLLQPIQRLPRYQLLLNEIIKVCGSFIVCEGNQQEGCCLILGKSTQRNAKQLIAVVCRAEKSIQRLLDTVNESMSINDITEIYEATTRDSPALGLGFGILSSAQFFIGDSSDFEVMLLVPKYDSYNGTRRPINILAQGKFRKMSKFDIFDHTLKRRYIGKVFLFEKCIIYTELINDELLEYRGHYEKDLFGMCGYDGKNRFSMFSERNGVQEVEFYAEINQVEDWYKLLHRMLTEVIAEEKKKVSTRKISTPTMKRASVTSTSFSARHSVKSWFSNSSGLSVASSTRDSVSSVDSFELGNSKWNFTSIVEKVKTTEKHYILLLISNRKQYLSELPEDVIMAMGNFFTIFHTILNFHHYQFYPELKKNGTDMLRISNVFKEAMQQDVFDVYYRYAVICGQVEGVLQGHFRGNNKEEEANTSFQPIDAFIASPLAQVTKHRKTFDILIEKLRNRELFSKSCVNQMSGGDGSLEDTIQLLQTAAYVQVELEKIEKRIQENYKLYNIKKNRIPDMEQCCGLVLTSELVSTDGLEKYNHRLFLTEKSLVCVKLKVHNSEEYYADVVYAISYSKLDIRKSQSHKQCLKLYSKSMKHKKFVVHFMNGHKMNAFADRLVKHVEE